MSTVDTFENGALSYDTKQRPDSLKINTEKQS